MSGKLCLKWNDFQSNISNSFSVLRNEDYLHDVTIVTDDSEQIAAHKLVLSACSDFFKSIFKRNKHPNPLLCLEGVSSKDVRNVMDYIYNGEVQVFQEDLGRFLNVAQRLKLEGLLKEPDADQEQEEEASNHEAEPLTSEEIIKRDLPKKNINEKPSEPHHQRVIAKANFDIRPDNTSGINEQIEQYIGKNLDGTHSCKLCGQNAGKWKTNMRNHIETHLEGLCFNCQMCEKTFSSRSSLGSHKSRFHKQ